MTQNANDNLDFLNLNDSKPYCCSWRRCKCEVILTDNQYKKIMEKNHKIYCTKHLQKKKSFYTQRRKERKKREHINALDPNYNSMRKNMYKMQKENEELKKVLENLTRESSNDKKSVITAEPFFVAEEEVIKIYQEYNITDKKVKN